MVTKLFTPTQAFFLEFFSSLFAPFLVGARAALGWIFSLRLSCELLVGSCTQALKFWSPSKLYSLRLDHQPSVHLRGEFSHYVGWILYLCCDSTGGIFVIFVIIWYLIYIFVYIYIYIELELYFLLSDQEIYIWWIILLAEWSRNV